MAHNTFTRYKEVKKFFERNLNGYQLDKLIALDLITIVYLGTALSVKKCLFAFAKLDFSSISQAKAADTFCTIGPYRRKDYYEIFSFVTEKVKSRYILDISELKFKFCFSIRNILTALRLVFMQRISNLRLKEKTNIFFQLVHYLNCLQELEKLQFHIRYKQYLAFSSVHSYEALFTMYFQKYRKPTYSLQHGLYFVFQRDIPLDALLYENFISDYHFCWGAYTKNELMKYGISEHKLLVGGYPRPVQYQPVAYPFSCTNCVVYLARYAYDNSNAALIEILKAFKNTDAGKNVKFEFKLHPTLNTVTYQAMVAEIGTVITGNVTLKQVFEKGTFDFSIAVNTAAYYESYIFGVPSLRYTDGTFENSMAVRDDEFSTLAEFNRCIEDLRNIGDMQRYNDDIREKLRYIIGLGISNYEDCLSD